MQTVQVHARLFAAVLILAASTAALSQRVTSPANVASVSGRLIAFPANALVRVELKSHRDAPIPSSGWKPKFRFSGQADLRDCAFTLPQLDGLVLRDERKSGTIKCTTAWKIDDGTGSFEVFEDGVKVADGKLVH